ncbi:MAG: hybrid sensor histidine kinase/response regulator [Elusimicrobiota bacterium]|nr:hybrid sensor histidine kinase/response regulator [Elusimicrobiota bacterium]
MACENRVNVLMIDDDPEALLLMGMRLNEACGTDRRFVLEGAETLEAGLAQAGQEDYDVILLDLNLPDSRGLATVATACGKAGNTPIVVLTCFEDEAMGLEAIGLGAQDYLIKDRINMTFLGRAIRFAIERSALLRQARELEQLRAEVRERRKSDQFKDRLLGAVSHELRSPLTVAQAAVANLADGLGGKLSPEQAELVEMAGRNLDRLGRLVINTLDFSRLDSGRACLEFRRVDSRRLISELTSDWKRALAKPLRVELDLADGLPAARADADHFAQMLSNLLDNAARHAARRVGIKARAEGGMLRVTVEDDGPGVPPECRGEIFVPYVQLNRAAGSGYKGTGLGLAISREIAALSSGRLWLDEAAAPGARFHFELPLWTAPAATVAS